MIFRAGRASALIDFDLAKPATRADEMFNAIRGRGSQMHGEPSRVPPVKNLSESLLGTGFPTRKRSANPNIRYYWEYTLRSHGVRRAGAAALDLQDVGHAQPSCSRRRAAVYSVSS